MFSGKSVAIEWFHFTTFYVRMYFYCRFNQNNYLGLFLSLKVMNENGIRIIPEENPANCNNNRAVFRAHSRSCISIHSRSERECLCQWRARCVDVVITWGV